MKSTIPVSAPACRLLYRMAVASSSPPGRTSRSRHPCPGQHVQGKIPHLGYPSHQRGLFRAAYSRVVKRRLLHRASEDSNATQVLSGRSCIKLRQIRSTTEGQKIVPSKKRKPVIQQGDTDDVSCRLLIRYSQERRARTLTQGARCTHRRLHPQAYDRQITTNVT